MILNTGGKLKMINWKFNPENYNENGYQLIPPGKYRVRIENAEETKTKNTNKTMIKMTLKVSGYDSNVWYYMVFDNSTPEKTQRTDSYLGRIYNSFGIAQGNLNVQDWTGKVGAAEIANELDNKQVMRAVIRWFLRRNEQDNLPPWQEHPAAPVKSEMFDPNEPVPF